MLKIPTSSMEHSKNSNLTKLASPFIENGKRKIPPPKISDSLFNQTISFVTSVTEVLSYYFCF